jgi:hypothetical protein
MPTSVREQALVAFFDLFSGLSAYRLKKRMPNWLIAIDELPALVQIDGGASPLGGDDVSSGISGVVRMALRVTVVAGLRSLSTDALGADLSAARADILAAVGADPTLGGLVEHVRWDGDEDPIPLVEEGAPPHAIFAINFLIIHTEAELDPFSAI